MGWAVRGCKAPHLLLPILPYATGFAIIALLRVCVLCTPSSFIHVFIFIKYKYNYTLWNICCQLSRKCVSGLLLLYGFHQQGGDKLGRVPDRDLYRFHGCICASVSGLFPTSLRESGGKVRDQAFFWFHVPMFP